MHEIDAQVFYQFLFQIPKSKRQKQQIYVEKKILKQRVFYRKLPLEN